MGLKQEDITSLKELTNLKKLYLHRDTTFGNGKNLILSKGTLTELTNLRELKLSGVQIEDSGELTYLKNLEILTMEGLKDFAHICSLEKLKKLEIANGGYTTAIKNLEEIKNLKCLEELTMYDEGLTGRV